MVLIYTTFLEPTLKILNFYYFSKIFSSGSTATGSGYAGIPYPMIILLEMKYVLLLHLSPELPSIV
jgi:hypothetical protein